MDEKVMVDGVKRVVSKLLARRKLKRSYEYEVQWEGQPSSSDYTAWLSRDRSVSTLCVIFTVCWCATWPLCAKAFFGDKTIIRCGMCTLAISVSKLVMSAAPASHCAQACMHSCHARHPFVHEILVYLVESPCAASNSFLMYSRE